MRSRGVWLLLLSLEIFLHVLSAHPPPLRHNSSEIEESGKSTETSRAERSPQPPVVALLIPPDYFQGGPGGAQRIIKEFENYRPTDSEKSPFRKIDSTPIGGQKDISSSGMSTDLQREIDRGIKDVFYPKSYPMGGFEGGDGSYLQAVSAPSERSHKFRNGHLREAMRNFLKPRKNLHKPQTILGSSLVNGGGSENQQNSKEIFEQILGSNGRDFGFDSENIPVEGAYLTKVTTYNISKLVDENNKKGFIIEKRENFSTNLNYLDSNEKLTNYSDAHSSSLQRVLGHRSNEKQPQTYIPLRIYYAPNYTANSSESIEKTNKNIHEKMNPLEENKTPEEDRQPNKSSRGKSDSRILSEVNSSETSVLSSDQEKKTHPEFVGGQYITHEKGLSNNTFLLANLTDHNNLNDFVGGQFVKGPGDKEIDESRNSTHKNDRRHPFQFVDGQLINMNDKKHLSMNPGTTEKSLSDFVGGQFVVQPKTREDLLGFTKDEEEKHLNEFVGGQYVKKNKEVNFNQNETTPSAAEEIPSLNLKKNTSLDIKTEREPERKVEVLIDTDESSDKTFNSKGLVNLKGRSRPDEDEKDPRLEENPKKDDVIGLSDSDKVLKGNKLFEKMIPYSGNSLEKEGSEAQTVKMNAKGVTNEITVHGEEGVTSANNTIVNATDSDFIEEGPFEGLSKDILASSFNARKQNLSIGLQNQLLQDTTNTDEDVYNAISVLGSTLPAPASETRANVGFENDKTLSSPSGNNNNVYVTKQKLENGIERLYSTKSPLQEKVVFQENDDGVDVTVSVFNSSGDNSSENSSSESTESPLNPELMIWSRENNLEYNKLESVATTTESNSDVERTSKEDFNEGESILLMEPGSGRYVTEVVGNYLHNTATEPENILDVVKENLKNSKENGSLDLSLSASEVGDDNVVGDYSNIHSNRLKSQANIPNKNGVNLSYEAGEKAEPEVDDVELFAGKKEEILSESDIDEITTIPEAENISSSENPTEKTVALSKEYSTDLCFPLVNDKNVSLLDLLSGHFYFEKDGKMIALTFKDNPLKNCTSGTKRCKLYLDIKNDKKLFKTPKSVNDEEENKQFTKVKNEKRHIPEEDLRLMKSENRFERSTEISDWEHESNKMSTVKEELHRRRQDLMMKDDLNQQRVTSNEDDSPLDEPEIPHYYLNSRSSPLRFLLQPSRPKPVLSSHLNGNSGNDFTDYLNNRRSYFQDLLNRQVVSVNDMNSEDRDLSSTSSRGNYQFQRPEVSNKKRPARRVAQERNALDTEGEGMKERSCGCSSNAILQKAQPELLSYKHFVGKRNDILTNMVHAVKDWVVDTQL